MKYVIATHGKMASGIKNTIEMLIGKNENIFAIDAYIKDQNFENDFDELVNSFDNDEQIFIFTDICSGSVNQIVSAHVNSNIKVICGMNLPVVIEIVLRDKELSDNEIQEIVNLSKNQIIYLNNHIKM
ncbi:PTS sugar transporter subunit IIA [Anaerorhabdus sp.]|uniref:PTS sugar transporter subunit IIA n=1 Tax=Anaerorhabdus sp. TaxID=1872524 RepID=UPI002FC58D0E